MQSQSHESVQLQSQSHESVQLQSQAHESVQLQSQSHESVQLQSQAHESVQLQSQSHESVQLQSQAPEATGARSLPRMIPCCPFETSNTVPAPAVFLSIGRVMIAPPSAAVLIDRTSPISANQKSEDIADRCAGLCLRWTRSLPRPHRGSLLRRLPAPGMTSTLGC